jgi:uncharacterized protein DUF4258
MSSRFLFTRHAEEMLVERNIERTWVEFTVLQPDALESDPRRPGVIRPSEVLQKRDGRSLRVAYVVSDYTFKILTVFFDRARRRGAYG